MNMGPFLKASIQLSKEISQKGARGEQLTDAESNLMEQTALVVIDGLVAIAKEKYEENPEVH